MENLETKFNEATTQKILSGVVLAAANRGNDSVYQKGFGNTTLEDVSESLSLDSTFCLASCTKVVTSVAALQCVERGLITLDGDISNYLPEWKNAMILEDFDQQDKPILVNVRNFITLRHLITYTSGISGFENEELLKYFGYLGQNKATLLHRYFKSNDEHLQKEALPDIRQLLSTLEVHTLLFEPGAGWTCGQSTDWTGQSIERLTGMTLDTYCQSNIFQPLKMNSTTYRLLDHPHVAQKLIELSTRNADATSRDIESIYPIDPTLELGGSNLYSSTRDFMTFLTSLLGNDGRLLKPKTVDLMFDYRLEDPSFLRRDFVDGMVENVMALDHYLAGLVHVHDARTGRKGGTVTWQGATRCYWWVDRKAAVCGCYGSHIIGVHEKGITAGFYEKFVKAVYEKFLGNGEMKPE